LVITKTYVHSICVSENSMGDLVGFLRQSGYRVASNFSY
jgi:hypothetical protein